jgi:hypothetical protein
MILPEFASRTPARSLEELKMKGYAHILGAAILWSLALAGPTDHASAGIITAVGAVDALTDVSQLGSVIGQADFNGGTAFTPVPLGLYSPQGMTFHTGALSSILPGVTTGGGATSGPEYADLDSFGTVFPSPIAGGGEATGQITFLAGVATFSVPVTQFGLTASMNGTQYITAWDNSGALIGQVSWVPNLDASFVGLDSRGVAIAMIAFGNDDLFAGAAYELGGLTNISDNWIWATSVPEPSSFVLTALAAFVGVTLSRQRFLHGTA